MIDNILGNKTNILVLRFLTRFDNQFFSTEEIIKETGAGLKNVYDSLKVLSYEKVIREKAATGRAFYTFIADSPITSSIYDIFNEERKRIYLRAVRTYKIISEIESKITKIAGQNLVDILVFGSVAKGRDTATSDIDFCVLTEKLDPKTEQSLRELAIENKYQRELQFHIFTTEQFIAGTKAKNSLIMNILRDGISLKIGK